MHIEFTSGGFSDVDAATVGLRGEGLVFRALGGAIVARHRETAVAMILVDPFGPSSAGTVPARTGTYSVAEIRHAYPNAYTKWAPEDDATLGRLRDAGGTTHEMAAELGRQPSAVLSRLAKLGADQSDPQQRRVRFEDARAD